MSSTSNTDRRSQWSNGCITLPSGWMVWEGLVVHRSSLTEVQP